MKKESKQLDGQLNMDSVKKIRVGTYMQNVFRRDTLGVSRTTSNPSTVQTKYYSLEKKMLPNGYIEEVVEKDYPINAESVSSLAEGADYRNDPAQAIANAPQRVNLGDVTQAQAFLENPQNFARVYDDVKNKLLEYYKTQEQKPAEAPNPTEGGKVNE